MEYSRTSTFTQRKIFFFIFQAASYVKMVGWREGGKSLFQNIPDKIMVLRECIQVIMSSAMYADQRYFRRIELLQALAMPDRDQPVAGAVQDIGMAAYAG